MTALKTRLDTDNDRYAAHRSVNMLLSVLGDFIPRSCHREATERLLDTLIDNGLELTNSAQRKEYAAWKRLVVSPLQALQTQPPIFIGENPGTEAVQGE